MYQMDDLDRAILMILQRGIPLSHRPYADMAEEIGNTDEAEVIHRIARLKTENIIRRMSGFFNSHALGYRSMLIAVRSTAGHFDEAVQVINRYPGVTHNYERSHDFSIWFTLIAINQPTLDHILDTIEASPYVADMLRFEMSRRYKIDVTFDVTDKAAEEKEAGR